MKHWIPIFALFIGSLFAPVVVAAAPLICASTANGVTMLVPILGTTCAAAFAAKNTVSIPGLTNGNCPMVVSGELAYVACAGISGSDFPTGITTPNIGLDSITIGDLASQICSYTYGIHGSHFFISDPNYNGPFLCFNGTTLGVSGFLATDVLEANQIQLFDQPGSGIVLNDGSGHLLSAFPYAPSNNNGFGPPTCAIAPGGTSCVTTSINLPVSGMQCTANPVGDGTIGGVGIFAPGITYTNVDGAFATGTYTLTNTPTTGKTNTYNINGQDITNPQLTTNTLAQQASSDASVINNMPLSFGYAGVNATPAGSVITISSNYEGTRGNSTTTHSSTDGGDTVTANQGNLSGGVDPIKTYTISVNTAAVISGGATVTFSTICE